MLRKLISQILKRFTKRHKTMNTDKPVVFILGPTGVGKTKLSIELAKKFDGEIISADSMQVYRNLNIITNKVTDEEMQGVPHHMINFVDPLKFFTSVDYRNQTLPIIKNVLDRRKVPIVVGGTMYWIECLLYDVLVHPEANETMSLQTIEEVREDSFGKEFSLSIEDVTKETLFSHIIEPKYLRAIPAENLHKILLEIDPERAQFIHPSERRKIIRSLQIYQQTGKTHSDWLNEQKNIGSHLGGPLRFKNSLILLLTCDENVLNQRINKRIDQMLEMGLVQELLDFHEKYNLTRLESNMKPDYTEGIFQSIGFKEFHDYLTLPTEEWTSEEGLKIFKHSVEQLRNATRKYSREQIKWIRNRLLKCTEREVPPIFELDSTFPDHWDNVVLTRAEKILNYHINGDNILFPIRALRRGQVPESMEPKKKCRNRKSKRKS